MRYITRKLERALKHNDCYKNIQIFCYITRKLERALKPLALNFITTSFYRYITRKLERALKQVKRFRYAVFNVRLYNP